MKIGLTYDLQTDSQDIRQAEFDSPKTVETLSKALGFLGHTVVELGNAQNLRSRLQELKTVEIVFNIAEGSQGRCREAWVPTQLDVLGIPYVGSDPLALALSLDKHTSKLLASSVGVSTPRWITVSDAGELPENIPLIFPVIVKPRYEGSGCGIDRQAVVSNPDTLRVRVVESTRLFQQPVIIEEFIPSGELTVLLIGNRPPQALPAIQRAIDPSSRLSSHLIPASQALSSWVCPIELTPELDAAAGQLAVAVFDVLGCQDMARVDLRVDEKGQLYFLEINPLPSFDPQGTLGLIAEYLGRTYTGLIHEILQAALTRLKGLHVQL